MGRHIWVNWKAGWGKEGEGGGVTVFKSVGVGLQDVEITKLVVAMADGVGTEVDF